ncbi:MAG: hypothetical protein M1812_004582 [Candelaria pacifica]|nr:MAG: hypothetical protein M1812_004582 [Candelaria pacifica]
MTSTSTKANKLVSTSTPINILNNETARLYTHIQPVLVLALFYIRFNALVADPVPTLLTSLLPLSIIQISYVTICLPVTTKEATPSTSRKGAKSGQRKKPQSASGEQDVYGQVIPAILSLCLAFILGTPLLTIILILFGAPLTTHMQHNLLCAAHVSLLAVFPLIYAHGVDARRWREIAAVMLPFDEVFGGTIGTFVGAWLGAVPIPLDWDRDWQKWPVTIVTGAYLGYVVGKFAGGYLLKGKRIEFD